MNDVCTKKKKKKRKMVKKSRISGPNGMGHKKDGLVESNPKKKKVTVGKKKGMWCQIN